METVSIDLKAHLPSYPTKQHPQASSSPPSEPRYHPNISLLKRCTHLTEFQQIHARIIKCPYPFTHISVAKLVESLVNSLQIGYAREVFDEMPEPSTFVFNTMIRGHGENGNGHEGICLYSRMRVDGIEPDTFTYPFLLKACGSLDEGKGVHSLILKSGTCGSDVYSQTSLVSFYSSLGDIESARRAFDRMPERNVVSWTAMFTGYVRQKRYDDGLALFSQMQISEVEPNELTLVNVLSACANLGAYEMGKWVDKYVERAGIALNPTLGTALVDMYVKCGHIHRASQVFEKLVERSIYTWNAMIGGFAMHGMGDKALAKFSEMLKSGMMPDDITLIGVLSACAHSKFVEKGKDYFYSMERAYGIKPSIKHYGCLIDILGRAGLLDEVYEIVNRMPMEPNGVIWGTLLNCCMAHGNVELAELAMKQLVRLEPSNDGNYVLMSNVYASKGRWEDVARVRGFMKDEGILRTSGCSSIVIGDEIHEFHYRM